MGDIPDLVMLRQVPQLPLSPEIHKFWCVAAVACRGTDGTIAPRWWDCGPGHLKNDEESWKMQKCVIFSVGSTDPRRRRETKMYTFSSGVPPLNHCISGHHGSCEQWVIQKNTMLCSPTVLHGYEVEQTFWRHCAPPFAWWTPTHRVGIWRRYAPQTLMPTTVS